jgi:hypothetical protein
VPRSWKKVKPTTPTLRVSPCFWFAYEPRTEPNRKALTFSVSRRRPSGAHGGSYTLFRSPHP